MENLNKTQKQMLNKIVATTKEGAETCLFYKPETVQPLVDAGYVMTNAAVVGDAGKIGCRATDAGIEAIDGPVTFEIDSDVPVPAVRRASSGEKYPFDKLEVGQSFHIPKTEKMEDPAKSLASTVSSATARYYQRDENGELVLDENGKKIKTRKFTIRKVGTEDKSGKEGARIFRVEL